MAASNQFFGVEGLNDMEVDPAPSTNLPCQWQSPETDEGIAAFLRCQISSGDLDMDIDSNPLPAQAPEEDMDGVELEHTQFGEDAMMNIDESPPTCATSNILTEDQNMDDVPEALLQSPNPPPGPPAATQAATQDTEMGEAIVVSQNRFVAATEHCSTNSVRLGPSLHHSLQLRIRLPGPVTLKWVKPWS